MLKAVLVQGLLMANIVFANEVINDTFLLFHSDEIANWKFVILQLS